VREKSTLRALDLETKLPRDKLTSVDLDVNLLCFVVLPAFVQASIAYQSRLNKVLNGSDGGSSTFG
jgi:hypothetical protein